MSDEELVQVKIRVPHETHRRLKILSAYKDRSVNEMVAEAIEIVWTGPSPLGTVPW